jgi:hypothetical protein
MWSPLAVTRWVPSGRKRIAARCALSPVEKTLASESSPAFLAHPELARRALTSAHGTHHAFLPEVET